MSYILVHLCKVSPNHKMYKIQSSKNDADGDLETTMSQTFSSRYQNKDNDLDKSRQEARKKLKVHFTRGDDKTVTQQSSASVSF